MITLVWKSLDGEIEITIKVWLIAQPYTNHRPPARSNPFTVPRPPLSSLQGPSASAYVTYIRSDDALRAIQSVNNVVVDGRTLKVTVCSRCLVHQPARVALWEIARLSCDISPEARPLNSCS